MVQALAQLLHGGPQVVLPRLEVPRLEQAGPQAMACRRPAMARLLHRRRPFYGHMPPQQP